MGKEFGKLWFIRNMIYFRLSPYEQRAFPSFWANTWRGFRRDVAKNLPYAGPPLLLTYLILDWAEKENIRLKRKNPKDYENDC